MGKKLLQILILITLSMPFAGGVVSAPNEALTNCLRACQTDYHEQRNDKLVPFLQQHGETRNEEYNALSEQFLNERDECIKNCHKNHPN